MTSGGPDLIEIFRRARLAPTPVERDAILDQELGDDSATRELVLSLLRHDQADDSFLTRAIAVRRDLPATASSLVGATLGPYRVLRQIGSGGFADVYEAEQVSPVRRTVALKVLKPYLVTPEVVSRFRAEQQALAAMAHPCIASVYDASETPDGRPFFVMEFVAGEPLTAWIKRTGPTRMVILDVLTRVCDAVQHAHDRGVIHRDIKSSNVLIAEVDGVPMPKVIDFGVAKAVGESLTDRSIVTGAAQIIGTLGSMSPEQLTPGKVVVDTRTDVYALGALCFEALTGRPLYELEGLELPSAIRLVSEGEPTSLQTQARALGSDLRAILTKATETEKSRRYESPRALREDLLRARDNRPITARAPSWIDRTLRFSQRNKAVVAGVAATMLALTVGLIVSVLQATRASSAEAVAAAQRDEYAQLTRDTVTALQQAVESIPGALPVNRVLAERALVSLELLAQYSDGDPKIALDLSRAYARLAGLQGSLRGTNSGDRDAAIASLNRAVEVIRPALGDPVVGQEASDQYLGALVNLGEIQAAIAQDERAIAALMRAGRACEERLDSVPDDWYAHTRRMIAAWLSTQLYVQLGRIDEANELIDHIKLRLPDPDAFPDSVPEPGENAISCTYITGTMLGLVGRFDEAEQCFERAIGAYQERIDKTDGLSRWDLNIAGAHRHRALMRMRARNYQGAIESLRAAIDWYERARITLPDYRPLEHITILAHINLSTALRLSGDPDSAEQEAFDAIQSAERFLAMEPDANLWKLLVADAHTQAALAIEARCLCYPHADFVPAACAKGIASLDRAAELWASGEAPGPFDEDAVGPDEALAIRARLTAMALDHPPAP